MHQSSNEILELLQRRKIIEKHLFLQAFVIFKTDFSDTFWQENGTTQLQYLKTINQQSAGL